MIPGLAEVVNCIRVVEVHDISSVNMWVVRLPGMVCQGLCLITAFESGIRSI